MKEQIRTLAIFQMVQGSLEFVGGLAFAISPGEGTYGMYLALAGLGASMAGLVRIVAGLLNMHFRGRALGMAMLIIGLISGINCCCLPTSVALCAYGLVVYTNKDVQRAFARRSVA